MKIIFYDVAAPFAYTDKSLTLQAVRGTEGTIIRIAHALKNYHSISIAQHCRPSKNNEISDGVNYISCATADDLSPDVVILLRQHSSLAKVLKQFPGARHFFWLHNLPSAILYSLRDLFLKHPIEFIAVSNYHRQMIEKRLQGKWYQRMLHPSTNHTSIPPVHVLYNPIEDDLSPNSTQWKPQQMISTCSPYKGLPETLKLFAAVQSHFPKYELLIASPDNLAEPIQLPKQARFLGSLPRTELIQHIRESFCVFYPQTERVETFGLVYAEANAVGTPVLAHDFGAAKEVLSDSSQLIDGRKLSTLLEKISQWQEHRPKLAAREKFRLSKVVQSWLRLFENASTSSKQHEK